MRRTPTPPFTKMHIVLRQGIIVRAMACTIMGGVVAAAVGLTLGIWIIFAGLFCMAMEFAAYARFHRKAGEPVYRAIMLGTTVLAAFSFVVSAPILLANDTGAAGFMGALFIGTMLIYQAVYYGHDRTLVRFAVPPLIATIAFCFGLMAYQAIARGELDLAVMVAIMCPAYAFAIITMRTVLKFRSKKLRKLKADAESSDRAKSEFLANMSHEIRTPMNGIIAMTDMLQSSGLTPAQQQYADIITSSGENLLVIINDILDFSKLEARKLELDPAPFNLTKIVEEVASLIAPKTADGIDVATFVDPELSDRFVGDAVRIRQILLNLAGNASKFTETGSILITVTRAADPDKIASDMVPLSIRVHDTGIGIAPDALGSMFEKFRQATNGTTKLYGGTGLGLAICKDLIELMGGEIVASSVPERGSVFGFDIALPVADNAGPLTNLLPRFDGRRIAIQTRSPIMHWSLHCLLARQGATVMPWADPETTLQQIDTMCRQGRAVDLVVTDMRIGPHLTQSFRNCLESFPPPQRPAWLGLGKEIQKGAEQSVATPVRAEAFLRTAQQMLANHQRQSTTPFAQAL